MIDTSMRLNSYRDNVRNRTLYQLVAEVCGMHQSVEFDSNARPAEISIVLRLLAKQLDDVAARGVEPQDPWATARAHWVAQAQKPAIQTECAALVADARMSTVALEDERFRQDNRQSGPDWCVAPVQFEVWHGLRSGDKAA